MGCNQPFARITGLDSPTDIIGKSITDVVKVRSEAEGFIANNQRVIETGRPELGIQESYTSLNGEQRLIETSKAPLMDLEGDVAGIVITFQDITERQRAAQELQYSEQRFRSATANAPFPIMIHSEDGEVIQISATWTELTGYTHEDMPTTAAWAQLAYGDRAGYVLENYIHKLYALASRWDEGEFTIATRDGTQRIWQFSSAPLGVLSDGRRAATSMAVDVTERRQAELALRESEERYRTIHNQAALGLISFSAEGNVIDANPSFCRMVGYSRAELLSKTALQLTHPDDHAEFFPAVTRLFASGEDSLFKEKRCLRKDGSYFWVGATVSVVRGASGQIKHALGMLQDISQRKQNEAERERAEAQVHALLRRTQLLNRIGLEIRASLELDTILHNLVQAIVAELPIDSCTFGRYTHGADDQELAQLEVIWEKKVPGSASCLGIYRADQYPLTLEKIANDQPFRIDSSTAAPDAALADCLEQVGLSTYFCLPIHTAGGGIGSFQLGRAAADHPWTDEEIELFHSIANQVAIAMYQAQLYEESQAKTQALERSYQELQGAQIHMVQAEKMSSLGQLVAGIAHEINNPVGFIYGNLAAAKSYVNSLIALVQGYQAAYPSPPPAIAHLLEQADVDYILADFPKLLASMENGATRIQTIVQSLRTFSRLEQVEQSAVDINRRIENTLVILQNRLNGRAGRPEIAVVRQYGDLPRIECYGSLLDQVFLNLLVNAIDAIEEQQACASPGYQGQITITTAIAPGHRASISFQDNGIGMDEKTQASIFDPFFTTKPIGVGTGMGLSISYQIVTGNHKGRLYCRSIVDAGTTFVVEIPQSLT
ncbi:MAG: PAS domain S-box protein [Cyanobacteria bacterium P01_A01_bin.135]